MESVRNIRYGPLPEDSPYVKPLRMYYEQNGVEKNWDMIKVQDSVSIIIFNKTRKTLVFVKQFRPSVYYAVPSAAGITGGDIDLDKYPVKLGITLELCAGIVDKAKSFKEIAREEVLEECGYDVPQEQIEEVMTYRSGVGASSAIQTMYYCYVTDENKSNEGGGIDDELIEVVEYTIDQARDLVKQGANNLSPPSFLAGVLWFLANRVPS